MQESFVAFRNRVIAETYLVDKMFEWIHLEFGRCLSWTAVQPLLGSIADEPKRPVMRFEIYTLGNRMKVELRKLEGREVDGEVRSIPLLDRPSDQALLDYLNWPSVLDPSFVLKAAVNFLRNSPYVGSVTDLVMADSKTKPMAVFETPSGWMRLHVEPYITS